MTKLPDCNALFERYFERWYPEQWVQARGRPMIRPDLTHRHDLIGRPEDQLSPLPIDWQTGMRQQIDGMLQAALGDWAKATQLQPPIDLRRVDAFDKNFTADEIAKLVESSSPDEFSNGYVVYCCEFGAVLGHVLRQKNERLVWLLDFPYWESSLFDPKSGYSIPVFHWAIKKMSRMEPRWGSGSAGAHTQARSASEGQGRLAMDAVSLAGASGL